MQPTVLISTSTGHYTPQKGARAAERVVSANQKRKAVPLTKAGRLNNKLKSFFEICPLRITTGRRAFPIINLVYCFLVLRINYG